MSDAALGAQIRRHRMIKKMSQRNLGDAIGLSRSSIANIEAGRQPVTLGMFLTIAKALGVDDAALLPPRPPTSPVIPGMSWYEAPR